MYILTYPNKRHITDAESSFSLPDTRISNAQKTHRVRTTIFHIIIINAIYNNKWHRDGSIIYSERRVKPNPSQAITNQVRGQIYGSEQPNDTPFSR